jgi:hypothetical protein
MKIQYYTGTNTLLSQLSITRSPFSINTTAENLS